MPNERRWPPKPPKERKCDTYRGGWDVSARTPAVGERCKGEAVETVFAKGGLGIEMWLCAECVTALDKRGEIMRNPKRRKAT